MKHFFLYLLSAVLLLPALTFAQAGFELEPLDDLVNTFDYEDETTSRFNNFLLNTGASDDIFMLMLRYEDVPEGWETSMCADGYCFGSFVREYPDSLTVDESDTVQIDYHIRSAGTGILWLVVQSLNDPEVIDSLMFTVNAEGENVVPAEATAPAEFRLSNVYPNPFNSSARINFTIPSTGNVMISMITPDGRTVKSFANSIFSAGSHDFSIKMTPDLSSGLYLVKVETAGQVEMRKAVYIK
ncbi:MAG: T9SS type A sorting domain-containing protein [Candidatus Electryonea clarkiae]|nr:T9SS type A sorting domain-containing protein [Candidatus Electryonea clarkiae]MDP8287559.1 T9SS type A sorting domain-containing protein [Candidatus Electryonea clarkiae]